MEVSIHDTPERANEAAADLLSGWLLEPHFRNLMVAAGNTPLELYRRIAARRMPLPNLSVFVLDEYVGVPLGEPRNCANLLRRSVADAWRLKASRFFAVSSLEVNAAASIREHEQRIANAGGLDGIVLGLGQNGHIGFNEPGSPEDSVCRIVDLDRVSIEANREWFSGRYAPERGVTVGLRTILSARRIILLAYGPRKSAPVKSMIEGPRTERCPASLIQGHPAAYVFLDSAAAAELASKA
jgi:glucosamine-6-phosphate deaminase